MGRTLYRIDPDGEYDYDGEEDDEFQDDDWDRFNDSFNW